MAKKKRNRATRKRKPVKDGRKNPGDLIFIDDKIVGANTINADWGFLDDVDPNRHLRGQLGIRAFRDMRLTNTSVAVTLWNIENILQQMEWEITGDDQDQVDDLIEQRDNMESGFTNWIRLAAGAFQYGHSIFERIWTDDEKGIRLKDIAHRKQNTIEKWYSNDDGSLWGVGQYISKLTKSGTDRAGGPVYNKRRELVAIPVEGEKLMVITFLGDGSNPQGVSGLRPSFFHWNFVKQLYKLDAIFADRTAVPTPIIKIPDAKFQAEGALALAMLKLYRSHEQAGMVIKETWTPMFDEGSKKNNDSILKSIDHNIKRIKETLLQGILSLGDSNFGSKGVGGDLNKMLFMSMSAMADFIAEHYNRLIIKPTIIARYGVQDKYPKMKATGLDDDNIKDLIDGITKAVEKDIVVVDKPIRDHVRAFLGLPEESDEVEQILSDKKEMADKLANANPFAKPGEEDPDKKPGDPKKPDKEDDDTQKNRIQMNKMFPWTARRKPKEIEAHIKMDRISSMLTNIETTANDKIQRFKRDMFPWVGKQVKDTNGAPRLTSRPPGFSTLRKMMRESSLDAYHFGEREYTAEVTRLEKSDKIATSTTELHAIKITLPVEKDVLNLLNANLNSRLDDWMKFYFNSAVNTWNTLKKKNIHGIVTKAQMLPELMKELRALSDRQGEEFVRGLTSTSNGEGRMTSSRTNKKKAPKILRSAIFDFSLCDNCAPHDGMVYAVGDPRAVVPDPDCLGTEQRCRCFISPAPEGA